MDGKAAAKSVPERLEGSLGQRLKGGFVVHGAGMRNWSSTEGMGTGHQDPSPPLLPLVILQQLGSEGRSLGMVATISTMSSRP